MKRGVVFLISLCLALGFQIVTQQQNKPLTQSKIPEFMGLGYHALYGNPFSNHIDEGFRNPIFQFTFQKSQTTQDGKYIIPDYTHSTQTMSCSLQSKISEYTGTQNYQKQLQRITKIDGRLSLDFVNAAFSFSRTFNEFSNSTINHKQTSYQSNAECTVYNIQMPLYSNQIQLSLDFISGVKTAMTQNNWDQFIQHFGTHYASSVTFGGRYFIQHTYSQESMSLFTSMKLDIQLSSKIQYYTKIGINLTQQMKKYQNQTNLVNNKVEVQRISTIGGLPPQSGNWIDWANTVKDNLAPVSYHLTTLSVLFNFIYGIDSKEAIKSFQQYLNSYCAKKKCPPLNPERPPPKPLQVTFTKSSQLAGAAKSSHTYDTNDGNIRVAMRVNKVLMGTQGSMGSIQFFLTDGIVQHALPVVGNQKFNHSYETPKGDQIRCIRFGITYNGSYWKFSSMQFVTKGGVQSQVYSGTYNINQFRIICLQNNNEHFVGFYGRFGTTFDSIGFNIMKETVQQ